MGQDEYTRNDGTAITINNNNIFETSVEYFMEASQMNVDNNFMIID